MIDYSNELFNYIATQLRSTYTGITVKGEYVNTPTSFPCVTVDEISNIPSNLDSGEIKYVDVVYRVQIFTNGKSKRRDARKIYSTVADLFYAKNLITKTYATTPTIYNSDIYEIQATFNGTINRTGTIYR